MKRLLRLAALLLALMLPLGTALANSWGLKGRLYEVVAMDSRWKDYIGRADQCGDFGLLGSRYHNVLVYVDARGVLHTAHTAVWQPDDKVPMTLSAEADGFTLTAGAEAFTFAWKDGECVLVSAEMGSMHVTLEGAAYVFDDGADRVPDPGDAIRLDDFNIRLFPRTAAEARHTAEMREWLSAGADCLGDPKLRPIVQRAGSKTVPVYSSPFGKSAWRAAKGKAAVSLKDYVRVLCGYTNADGADYACVLYEVSERTSRIGWIEAKGLKAAYRPSAEEAAVLLNEDVRVLRDTFLTDDPLVSQYAQFDVPADTLFTCMGLFGRDWAYVAAEVTGDGRFTDGGAVVWGFVPLRDVGKMW